MTTQSGAGYGPTAEQPKLTATTDVMPAQAGQPQVVYMREPRSWGRRLLAVLATFGVLLALVFGLQSLNFLPRFSNPFAQQTTDKTGPVLLESMRDLSQYTAAEGNFQVLVDVEQRTGIIPSFLVGRHTLFVGVGSVDAYVDFSKLTAGNVVVSPDGKSVSIKLPAPQLGKPNLDVDRSYTAAEEKGVLSKIGDAFNGDPNDQQKYYQLARDKIAEAGKQTRLVDQAEKNTQAMLTSLMTQLGFEHVTITFDAAAKP